MAAFNKELKQTNLFYEDFVTIQQIDLSNVSLCLGEGAPLKLFTKYLKSNEKIKAFIFFDKLTKEACGYYWLFFKGAHEWEYTICGNGESALISSVYVFEKWRGKRLMQIMIEHAFQICRREGIKYIYASVRKNNASAWKAYNRVGYELIENRQFIRFLAYFVPIQHIP